MKLALNPTPTTKKPNETDIPKGIICSGENIKKFALR
jgi:hypothetical protein